AVFLAFCPPPPPPPRRTTPTEAWGNTTAGISMGTLLYMAPEQAAADPDLDGRADLYSLGVTAYEMLTGDPPFAHLPARSMLAARMSLTPPSLASKRSDVPPALDRLLLRCLAADPADRPQTAQELIDALDAPDLLADAVSVPAKRGARRWSIAFGTAATLAICGLAGYGSHSYARDHAAAQAGAASARPAVERQSKVAIVPFVDLGTDTAGAELAEGLTNAVADNLSKSSSLAVVSPSAAAAVMRNLRNGSHDATQHGADLLLEGTVQREKGRLRVTARLSNTSDGVMRWADVYDRRGNDMFDVTDDIAVAIVASVSQRKG
ncbi:MAG: serine/threonine-protein kinase, partial [Gemmatimonadaceae bacterium]